MKIVSVLLLLCINPATSIKITCTGMWAHNDNASGTVERHRTRHYFASELNKYLPKLLDRVNLVSKSNIQTRDVEDDDQDFLGSEESNLEHRMLLDNGSKLSNHLLIKRRRLLEEDDDAADDGKEGGDDNKGGEGDQNGEGEQGDDEVKDGQEPSIEMVIPDVPTEDGPDEVPPPEPVDDPIPIVKDEEALVGLNRIQTDIGLTCILDGQFMHQVQTFNMACNREIRNFTMLIYMVNGDTDRIVFPFTKGNEDIKMERDYDDINYLAYSILPDECKFVFSAHAALARLAAAVLVLFALLAL